jgi:hypothetical protein
VRIATNHGVSNLFNDLNGEKMWLSLVSAKCR